MNATMALLAALAAAPVVDVQVDPAIDDAAQVREWIEKEGAGVLQERGVESKASEGAWKIGVAIGGATYEYQVQLSLERDGAPLADQPAAFGCECTNEQLIAKVEVAIGEAIDALESEPETPTPIAKSVEPPSGPPPAELEPDRKIGGMGIAGAVLIPIGVGAVIAGGVLIGRGEVSQGDPTQRREVTDYRPVGIAVAVTGGVLLVTGITLLAVDRVRARRRSVVFVPQANASEFVLSVNGRF